MAKDFRPKGSRPDKKKTSAALVQHHAQKPVNKSAPLKKKKANRTNIAQDLEDSTDEETLMREIKSFGGSKEDLELVSRGNGKQKPEVHVDEASFSGEVAAFLKQLQTNPAAAEPGTTTMASKRNSKGVKNEAERQSKAKVKGKDASEAPSRRENNPSGDAKNSKVKARQPAVDSKNLAATTSTIAESTTAKQAGKGKKVLFDDDGVGTAAAVKQSHLSRGSLRLDAVPNWMTQALPSLPKLGQGLTDSALSHERVTHLLAMGTELMQQESQAYDRLTNSETSLHKAGGSIGTLTASDAHFVRSLLSSDGGGTLSDRISALTLLVQSSPVHNTRHMETLLTMSRKKNREESSRSTRALADWFASEGGLGVRKLKYFRDQPLLASASAALATTDPVVQEAAKSHILLWAFEDYLKKLYFNFLQALETQSHDTIAFTRKQAITQIFILLRDKPEQEQNLLRLMVNKLGDPERSVAAKTSNHVLELLTAHPAMKFIVVREIANLVMRPTPIHTDKETSSTFSNHNTHARYYGLLTLNQTVLTIKDEATANHLILLYFELFESILRNNEQKEDTIAQEGDGEEGQKKKVDKKRWKNQPKKGRGKGKSKAKSKHGAQNAKVPEEPKLVKDAESRMVAAILAGVRRAFPFAKIESSVFEKHINTLFKILHTSSFNICIQAMQLIFQLTISNPHQESSAVLTSTAITDRFYRVLYDSLLDPRLESSSKQAMYLNLIFQALKADDDHERVKAFVKRICQVLSLHQPSFICGCLHLLGELLRRTPGLRGMLSDPEDDGEEHFVDAPENDNDEAFEKAKASRSAVVRSNRYDGRKREPRFANAGSTCLWDILPLIDHYHPSVSVHALQLLQGDKVTTSADLSLNTLSHFLDRFVYRNPKQKASLRGASAMQPMPASDLARNNVTRSRTHALNEGEFFNTEAFWKQQTDTVPEDQLFFHKFFNLKSRQLPAARVQALGSDDDGILGESGDKRAPTKARKDIVADVQSETSLDSDDDPDEQEVWKAMKATMPDKEVLQGFEDSDDDDDEFDFVDGDSAVLESETDTDEDADGPNVEPDVGLPGEEGGTEDTDADDWDDLSEEGQIFGEDEDDLLPFTDFDDLRSGKRGTKRGAVGEGEDEEAEEATVNDKRRKKSQDKKSTKKAMQNLPTFASADDYAHLLGSDDDDENM